MRPPRCWMVCDSFAPFNLPGTHRNVHLCRRLAEEGYEVTVFAPQKYPDVAVDEALLELVPSQAKVIRTPVWNPLHAMARILKKAQPTTEKQRHGQNARGTHGQDAHATAFATCRNWLSWWLHIPDGLAAWTPPTVFRALREARLARPDVIFSSAPAFSSHVIAMKLRALLGAKWLADFRDPWTDNSWRQIPYSAHRRLDRFLERRVVAAADRISATSDSVRDQLAGAHPACAAKMTTVLNGFDPDALDAAPPHVFAPDQCTLVHAGTFYGPRTPHPLLQGLQIALARRPEWRGRLRLVLIGCDQYEGESLTDLADKYQVASAVEVLPHLPYARTLSYIKGADAAVLLGQHGSQRVALVPAKTYDYIGAGKGVLAIEPGEEVCRIVPAAGCTLWRADADGESVADAIQAVMDRFAAGPMRAQTNRREREPFARARMAEKLAGIIGQMI